MVTGAPGFYGKVPARGDFIGRRVPPAFAAQWDSWLGTLALSAHAAAGPAWPEAWLTAPLWHFAIGATLAGPPGAAGVLIASADRVGRLFPFTILGPAAGIPTQPWCDAVEALALDALDDAFDPDALDDALHHLGPPPPGDPLDPASSLWRCRGSGRVAPTTRLIPGLPTPDTAAAMVLGPTS